MKIFKYTFLLLTVVQLLSCKEEIISERDFPRLTTCEVTNISSTDFTLNAEVLSPGMEQIIEYGFVWDDSEYPALGNINEIIFTQNLDIETFSAKINQNLSQNVSYYVRAFVRTNTYLVYGKNVKFTY